MSRIFLASIIALFFVGNLLGQDQDPVLFTVAGNPVPLSEFEYIYNKNNAKNADYSEESLTEYLDLYKKFKLKVQKAKDLQLDTIVSLKNELAGYREQLAKSYLVDKGITEKLLEEVYERKKEDLNISHIFIPLPRNYEPKDTLVGFADASRVHQALISGADWKQTVEAYSKDNNNNRVGGTMGWFTSLLPNGFYDFENTIYSLKKGQFSGPVRSPIGYHIIKLNEKRPARGEIQVAHILIRKDDKNKDAKVKLDSIQKLIDTGLDFSMLVKSFSQDSKTRNTGGVLPRFGINKYDPIFEDACFALNTEGEISQPIETSSGWHIIKLIKKYPLNTYELEKRRLQALVNKDARLMEAKDAMIGKLKTAHNFKENKNVLNEFASAQGETFYGYKWEGVAKSMVGKPLFSMGDKVVTVGAFSDFLKKNARARLRMNKKKPLIDEMMKTYESYVSDQLLEYEKSYLEKKYPEFKALMREYSEGILLFEATKLNVWDKASQDSVGLLNFYEENKSNYQWGKRAKMRNYIVNSTDAKLLKKIMKTTKKKGFAAAKTKFDQGGDLMVFEEETIEANDETPFNFVKGFMAKPVINDKKTQTSFSIVTDVIPPSVKKLDEARGYVIADYQDFLEKKWVSNLVEQYPIELNQEVFNSLIKK